MYLQELKRITSVVKSLKYDGTRAHMDNIAHIYLDGTQYYMVCTNGYLLCHFPINCQDLNVGNYRVIDKPKFKKSEEYNTVSDDMLEMCLELSSRDYVKFETIIPTKFNKTIPNSTINFGNDIFSQAIKAFKCAGVDNWKLCQSASLLAPMKLEFKEDTYILVMPRRS